MQPTKLDGRTDGRANATTRPESVGGLIVERPEHDLGALLAENQVILHRFTIRNQGATSVRLVRATALTPCCSAVEDFAPGPLAPGGSAQLAVSFRPGRQTGWKRVDFLIESDTDAVPTLRCVLLAQLIGGWEFQWLKGSATTLPANRPGEQRYRVIHRQKVGLGRGAPTEVVGSDPLRVEWTEPPATRPLADGIEEWTRPLRVALPALAEAGNHHGELSFRRPDGHTVTEPIFWTVTLPLTVVPSGFVLPDPGPGPVHRVVVVRGTDHPFRITGAAGPLVPGSFVPPSDPARSHRLDLAIDPSQLAGVGDIRLTTDHPDQPEVSLSVLIPPPTGLESRP